MKILLLGYALVVPFFLVACNGGAQYGAGVDTGTPKVQVKDIFMRSDLMGKKVTLEGRVVSQCASNGCWFYLQDETGQVYVDLSRNGFELPSLPNKTVIASGTVARSQQAFLLIATGVEVK
ncbi:DNA-binding protein [Desulfobulbus alkaliphilus]|uniref:DNA-binding protein n=1 Tax=Desulfobulbus alkaliphilus TaxID=869814 RepID=UPI001964B6B8|nr:DNA-binding protein [Desulfobulbus alkaliphilus]MBM9537750.1 DNA-binding protein [Desulfobulbus alkaliphilus]